MKHESYTSSWFSNTKNDILSGITVALALIPEAIAFAIICGVDPIVGLHASFCIAVTIAFLGGRPGMISAATGAMALVLVTLVKDFGIEYMFAASVLAGIFQFIFSRLKSGDLINLVPHSVIIGFVNALAILIFMAQLPHFAGASWVMYAMVLATLSIIYLLPKITKAVPSALVAIIAMVIFTILSGVEVKTVGDMGNITRALPAFHLPNIPFTIETLKIITPYALTLSFVGMIESLLTATIIDDMTDTKSDKNAEIRGQGIANIVTGLFGGMAGCAMIGQSVINIKSGGRKRLSAFTSGVMLLFLITCLCDIVKAIPIAALVGVMIMVSISTFEWNSFKEIRKMPKNCAAGMITSMSVIILTHNLALGVFAGVIISSIVFAWKTNGVSAKVSSELVDGENKRFYRIHGQLFFASTAKFKELFDYSDECASIIIDFEDSNIWDYSAVNSIVKVREKFQKLGKELKIVGLSEQSRLVIHKVDDSLILGT